MENEESQGKPKTEVEKWFEDMDRFNSEPFFPDHKQTITPERKIFE